MTLIGFVLVLLLAMVLVNTTVPLDPTVRKALSLVLLVVLVVLLLRILGVFGGRGVVLG